MSKFKIIDFDIIYLSYDEPNAEKNYADLLTKAPWAKRVHSVKGSDAAHKACANLSGTDRFITVDADNIVHENFFNQELNFDENKDLSKCVISWCGYNVINGLMYGNGGLKLWPKEYVLNMQTHENAPADDLNAQVDFCWDAEYIQMNSCFSTVHNNATPYQAWRAGFREGVKMSLNEGAKADDIKRVWWQNYHRLLVWSNIGSDVDNGIWSMLGAREGCYKTNCTDWDYANVRDFDYLTNYWNDTHKDDCKNEEYAISLLSDLGKNLKTELDLEISNVDASGSKFFKKVYTNTDRILKR
jgi:hypothetical protein